MLNRKTNIFVTILFAFIAFLLIGTTNVNAATTEIVTTEQELRNALDGRVGAGGTGESDTETTYVKLNNNIALNGSLTIYVSTDLTLDLNGYTIEPAVEKASVSIYYGNNRKDMFTNGSLTIKDSSEGKTGTIKSYDCIYIRGNNTDDVDKHFALTIESGNFYVNERNVMFKLVDNTTYEKTHKATYDFQINGGIFTIWGSNTIFLYSETLGTSYNTEINFNLDKLTIKGNNTQFVYASKDFKVSDVVSADSRIKFRNSYNSNEATLTDRTVYASKTGALKNKVGFEYDTIEITKPYDFEVSDVNLTETYGYTAGTFMPISIRSTGDEGSRIIGLYVFSVYGVSGEENIVSSDFIIEEGNKTAIAPGTTDTSWKIKAKSGLTKGTYTATIVVTNNAGKQYKSKVTLTVNPKTLNLRVGGVNSQITYGNTYTPVPTILVGSNPLSASDYKITYAEKIGRNYVGNTTKKPTEVGEYRVTITVTNTNYTANAPTADFKIVAKTIEPTVDDILAQTYTGGQIAPEVTVRYDGKTLTKGTDYTVVYGMNQNVGQGTVTIKPVSGKNHTFENIVKTFNITTKTLTDSNVILDTTSFELIGSAVTPAPVVKDGGRTLTKDVDYELSYSNNTSLGDAMVTVTGKGNYTGTVKKDFTIMGVSETETKARQVIVFADSSITKTYGDSNFTKPVSVTVGDGAIAYISSDPSVATVDESGEVTIKKVGTTTITATASETENYESASDEYTLTVEKKELSFTATVNDKEFDYYTTATVSGIEFSGLVSGETLTLDTDYTVSAMFMSDESGAENVGNDKDVSVTITLNSTDVTSNYRLTNSGNYTAKANITPMAISGDWIILGIATYEYTGTAITPGITVTDGDVTFRKDIDYTVEYLNNINAGTAKIKVKGIGNYSGEAEKTFTINPKPITPTIENIPAVTYNGSNHTPVLVVKSEGTILGEGVDYTVEYTDNLNAGTAKASITKIPTSNYTFETTDKSFTINKYAIKEFDIELEYTSTVFDNTAKQPTVTVKVGEDVINANNYVVTYADNTNVGTASVTVAIKEGVDNFTGSATVTFAIVAKESVTISGITSNQEFIYDGTAKTPSGEIAVVGNKVSSGDLEVSYAGTDGTTYSSTTAPTNVGTYTVTYKVPESNETYTGTATFTFVIKKATSTITISNLSQTVGSIVEPTYTVTPAVTDGTVKVEYKLSTADDSTYTEALPTEAGTYSVRVSVTGDKNLNDKSEVATLEIARKATGGGGGGSSTTTYTITVEENKNAEVTPNGKVKVEKGDDKTFKITAKEGYEIEDVLVDGKSVGAVSEYTFEDVKAKHTLAVKVKKVEEKPTTPEVKETFKDVKKNEWHFEAIEYVAKKGLMNGTGNDMFSPNEATTRGMIVTILYRLEGEPEVEESSFTDVPSGAYYAKAIAWAEKNGIVSGYGDGKFGPDDEITREQLATIMYRYSMYKKYDTSVGEDTNILSYNDIQDLAEYAFPAMQYACGDGLISGMGDGNLAPKGNATRAQVATILMRYCEKYMK